MGENACRRHTDRGRKDHVPGGRQRKRRQLFADSFGKRAMSEDEDGNVRAKLERKRLQLVSRNAGPPEVIEREQHACGVRAAASEATAERQLLDEGYVRSERRPGRLLEQTC